MRKQNPYRNHSMFDIKFMIKNLRGRGDQFLIDFCNSKETNKKSNIKRVLNSSS